MAPTVIRVVGGGCRRHVRRGFSLELAAFVAMPQGWVISAACALLTLYGLAIPWLNRTEIRIERRRLLVSHGPLPIPWLETHRLAIEEVDYVVCDEKTSGKGYVLRAVLKDGPAKVLLRFSAKQPLSELAEAVRVELAGEELA